MRKGKGFRERRPRVLPSAVDDKSTEGWWAAGGGWMVGAWPCSASDSTLSEGRLPPEDELKELRGLVVMMLLSLEVFLLYMDVLANADQEC